MPELTVDAGGVKLWSESFGQPTDPAVLLIMGAGGQGICWQEDFIAHFVEAGLMVIRYDHRDTGMSSCVDLATDPYTVDDLASDAVAILDAHGVRAAHLVG